MENKALSWPHWPLKMRTSSSQAEGATREFAVMTTHFSGDKGKVKMLHATHVDAAMKPVDGSEFELPADLVLAGNGFCEPGARRHVERPVCLAGRRGNVKADTKAYQTNRWKVFSAGDMRRGQSLVVWAIREGRQAARSIDEVPDGLIHLALVVRNQADQLKRFAFILNHLMAQIRSLG